jgi:hypothetical protein
MKFKHTTVVAYLALFVALGGSAVAAGLAQKNSVVSKSIKNGSVRAGDVRDGGLTGADLADDGVTGADVDEASLGEVPAATRAGEADTAVTAGTAQRAGTAQSAERAGTADAVAASSVTGAGVLDDSLTGADVEEAKLGVPTAGLEYVSAASADNSVSPKFVTVECPPGKRAIFGGYDLIGGKTGASPDQYSNIVMDEFLPNGDGRRIITTAFEEEPHAGNWQLFVSATCVNAG